MLVAIGTLFVIVWAVGIGTVGNVGWYVYVPLVIGAAAIGFGIMFPRRAEL